MTREACAEELYNYICDHASNFNAPYGVLMGNNTNKTGKKYVEITFGRTRTLAATAAVYGPKFIHFRTSTGRNELVRSLDAAKEFVDRL